MDIIEDYLPLKVTLKPRALSCGTASLMFDRWRLSLFINKVLVSRLAQF